MILVLIDACHVSHVTGDWKLHGRRRTQIPQYAPCCGRGWYHQYSVPVLPTTYTAGACLAGILELTRLVQQDQHETG